MAQIRVDDFVGTSNQGWEDAARNAVSQMAGMAESIVGVDVLSQSAEVENQEITEFRTTVRIAYTLAARLIALPLGRRLRVPTFLRSRGSP